MKRPLALLLLLGAMIGLFGQEMAFASGVRLSPTSVHAKATQAETMPDCTMPVRKHAEPCNGLTLECIAAMGCTIPLAVADAPAAIVPISIARIAPVATTTKRLTGLRVLPEAEPPTV